MYFDYYTRNVDDVTVLRVLKLFADEVLSTLQREDDEFIFLRADNGQLDTIGVKAYTRKQGVITQFIQPYHPNMNGFVERSFSIIQGSYATYYRISLPLGMSESLTSYGMDLLSIMLD
jgi:hypothetical protein